MPTNLYGKVWPEGAGKLEIELMAFKLGLTPETGGFDEIRHIKTLYRFFGYITRHETTRVLMLPAASLSRFFLLPLRLNPRTLISHDNPCHIERGRSRVGHETNSSISTNWNVGGEWMLEAGCEARALFARTSKKGRGVTQDYKDAVKWLTKAAEQRLGEAQANLGVCYVIGNGVTKDEKEAVKWYTNAAEQGNATAQKNLGFCYMNGSGVIKDEKEAVKWYTKAAEQGNEEAQYNLGACYANGIGVTQDYKEAVKCYTKSAEQGYVRAQYILGICYYEGKGAYPSYKKAVKWWTKAAKQGDADAKKELLIRDKAANDARKILKEVESKQK